jgi:Protein of unknown function (DUF2933)
MRNLLPLILVLACPIMMIVMMRGMHGGGQGTKAGHDSDVDQTQAGPPALQAVDQRITQLEHELAQLRDLQGRQSPQDGVHRP